MPTYHQPKKMSFVPPILRRRFIVPDNPRELGTLVAIIGLAISLISAGPTVLDLTQWMGKRQAEAKLVATVPFRANLESRLVGVYLFDDENKLQVAVRGDRVYLSKAAVAPKALVVWRAGRSDKAKTLFQYLDYLLGLPIGLTVLAWGLTIRVKRPDPFEEAMADRSDESGPAA
ncbi:hypothetical protein [Aquidulcibacter sp.]|uniref:hypothetical protein n=1 Tax=Aquidulcibacter sp. TaxID=2052990 RepID=UPI0025C4BA43|nr:hypothetical protein [Aquidulcibacter sp.]MCA3695046.1 hypothetical protein [Aquidulcibacter sp.]